MKDSQKPTNPASTTVQQTNSSPPPTALRSSPEKGTPPKRRKLRWLVLVVVLVGAVGGLAWTLNQDDPDQTAVADSSVPNFAVARQTDLIAVSSFDATLGRTLGDPISSPYPGILTGAVPEGTTVDFGEEIFRVDDQPVTLAAGELTAWRDLGLPRQTTAITNRLSGTITEVTTTPQLISPGSVLYRVDQQPVVVLAGSLPAYRDLSTNSEDGTDITQLERFLVDAGYDPEGDLTVDETFSSQTEDLVRDWQADMGMTEDGVINLGEIVFLPESVYLTEMNYSVGDTISPGQIVGLYASGETSGEDVTQLQDFLFTQDVYSGPSSGLLDIETDRAIRRWQQSIGVEDDGIILQGEILFSAEPIRVSSHLATVGTQVGSGPVLSTTSSDIVVRLDLPATDQDLLAEDDRVTVILPDQEEVVGIVQAVASVATLSINQANNTSEATFEVEIHLEDSSAATGLDEAPVDVEVITDSVSGVIAVPINSLLALAEGGYAVEIETNAGQTSLIGVDPGFYADGWVELVESEVSAGTKVVVP